MQSRNLRSCSALVAGIPLLFAATAVFALAAAVETGEATVTRETLQEQIQRKSQDLQSIQKEIDEKNKDLRATQSQRATLQRDIGAIEKSISQLSLGIKAGGITVEKLRLEIGSLQFDLADIQGSIESKREGVREALRTIHKNDSKNLLAIVLSSGSLADSVSEAQAIHSVQSRLLADIEGLRALHEKYQEVLATTSNKHEGVLKEQRNLEYRKLIVEDQKEEKADILRVTKNKESLYQEQLNELKKQQLQIASEIETLDAILRTEIDPSLLPASRPGVLAVPVDGGRSTMTQEYGSTAFAQNGYRGKWHNGVDFGARLGDPVYAAEDGTVAAAGNQDSYCPRGAYGRFVVVNHANGLTSMYAHLSRVTVREGESVKRGQVIGYIGSTGYSTGPHLHFTVYAQQTFYMGTSKSCGPMPHGGDLNPLMYL